MKALEIASRNMRNISTEFSVIAQNVAVSDLKNNEEIIVAKEAAFIKSQPLGSNIKGYTNNVDRIVQENIYERISEEAYYKELYDINLYINGIMGHPGEDDDIATQMQVIFDGLSELSVNAANPGARSLLVERMINYAEKLNHVAKSLQDKRFQIDQKIRDEIQIVNQKLTEANTYKGAIFGAMPGSLEHLESHRKFRATIEELSQYFTIRQITGKGGEPQLFLQSGQTLVGGTRQFFFKYTGADAVDNLVADDPLDPLLLSAYDTTGRDTNQNVIVVTGGLESERKSLIKQGRLGALIGIRDSKLPVMLKQIDSLAKNLKDAFNTVHNKGVGHPPPPLLSGSSLVSRDQQIGFTGRARLAVVDQEGKAVPGIDSMVLDLTALDSGDGPGKANLQSIVNEINYFFGQKMLSQNRVEVGNIKDIKLAALSKENLENEAFVLDFDLHNQSSSNATFELLSATGTDGNNNPLTISLINNNSFLVNSGLQMRTGNNSGPKISIANGNSIDYPYTVVVSVRVTPGDGSGATTKSITYSVNPSNNDPFNGFMNTRFAPTAVDTGSLVMPSVSAQGINASMQLGSESIANDSTTKAQLILQSGNSNWGIAIDNMDSSDDGISALQIAATGADFSGFFGLNDLFIRRDSVLNWANLKNTAYYLKVRDDIARNPDFLATGKLRSYVDFSQSTVPTNEYEVISSDFENGKAMFDIQTNKRSFISSDGVSLKSQSLQDYASGVIGSSSVQTTVSEAKYNTANNTLSTIRDQFMNAKGVNVNDQMTKMIQLMNVQSAQGRVINIQQRFFDVLFTALS